MSCARADSGKMGARVDREIAYMFSAVLMMTDGWSMRSGREDRGRCQSCKRLGNNGMVLHKNPQRLFPRGCEEEFEAMRRSATSSAAGGWGCAGR